jgi:hypothetical protein
MYKQQVHVLEAAAPIKRMKMSHREITVTPLKLILAACVLLLAFGAGRSTQGVKVPSAGAAMATQGSGSPDAAATATRIVELDELSALRTQVAQSSAPLVCTPLATSTPEPTRAATASPTVVPPKLAGVPVAYDNAWMVTVTGISLMPRIGTFTASGMYAQVNLSIVNTANSERGFAFTDLVLRDERGRVYTLDLEALDAFASGFIAQYPPSIPLDAFMVFDVAADAEGPFILESRTDPTFRVSVEVEVRG